MTAPITPKTRTFRVFITAWSAHTAIVDAPDETSAMAIAEALWGEDENAFSYRDGGIDGITAEEIDAERGR